METLDFCLTKESVKQSTLDRNVLVRSKWKSSSETLESPTNSNDNFSFSADDATSESEFDEHPYSVPKRLKTLNSNYCNKSGFQNKFTNGFNVSTKIMSGDGKESSCWPTSNVENGLNTCSSKTRRRGSKCESKNAVMARLNRLKKKKYVADLEDRNSKLEAENGLLKKALAKRVKEVSSLMKESVNLRSVIKNSTEIGSLLKCVQRNTNLHVTSSLLRNGSNSEQNLHSKKPRSDLTNSEPRPAPIDELANRPNDEGMIHELNLFHCDQQSILTKTKPSGLSTSENSLIDEIFDFNLDNDPSDNELICDLQGEITSNGLFNSNRPISSKTESKITEANALVRCETPSKDIDISVSNNDFLFNDVGVCFHIANKRVSLEFCESCNHKAATWSD